MFMQRKAALALAAALMPVPGATAQTRDAGSPPREERLGMDSLFGAHMVLQRDRPIRVWGRAKPGERVRVSFGEAHARTVAGSNGSWAVTLSARPAGGPYLLKASAPSFSDQYRDILVGDVWLCSGQSNMEFRRSKATDLPARFATDNGLRMLDIARREAPAPSPHLMPLGGWSASSADSAARFSAICHHFGERLRARLKVPIGLIGASWGGTRIAAFVDAATLARRGVASGAVDRLPRQNDGRVFNAMIAPLAPFGLKGVLWYQGESDTHRPKGYEQRLTALAASWRQAFDHPLPMIVIQLPPFDPSPRTPPGHWAQIREAQRRFVAGDRVAGLVVQIDQDSADNLHPTNKAVVAVRAAETALGIAYAIGRPRPVATLPRVERYGPTIILHFGVDARLTSPDGRRVRGYELCAETCVAVPGHLAGPHRVELVIPDHLEPRCLRYAWSDVPISDLRTESGWPLGPFAVPLRKAARTSDPACD